MFPRSALTLCQAKIVLCFLHEWQLPPSDVTDNGGNVGGKNGGDVPGLSQDEEKDASIDAKDAISSSKVASLADNGRNSAIHKQRQGLYKEPH